MPGCGSGSPTDLECRQIADLLGDYLEGSLPRETRELIDFHIDGCPPCVAFLNTYRGHDGRHATLARRPHPVRVEETPPGRPQELLPESRS